MLKTVAISLGRNIGAEPMPETAWNDFIDRAYRVLKFVPGSVILAVTQGKGYWTDAAGAEITEDTAIILAQVDATFTAGLRSYLAELAFIYAQDGIGFTEADADASFLPSVNPGRTQQSADALAARQAAERN